MNDPVISCRNVGIFYYEEPDNPDSPLNGIVVGALDVPAGGITAVMGPSGSGKSTLLSLMSGLKDANALALTGHLSRVDLLPDTPHATQILRGDVPGPGTVGFVFQDSHLMKALPVGLNLEMARSLTKGPLPQDAFEQLMTHFRFVGTQDDIESTGLRDKRVRNLSGGQQQRIAVGRAVASEPRLIFCDEPTSSLDPVTAGRIMDYLADWAKREGGTVLWVTHDEDLALRKADHILYVQDGHVVSQDGAPLALTSAMDLPARRAALDALKARGATQTRLTQADLAAHNLQLHPSSTDRKAVLEPPLKGRARARFDHAAILRFVWHFVIAELFERQAYARRHRGASARLSLRLWRGPYSFTKPTFALILCLGLITAYATIVSFRLLDGYFDRSLSRPEVAHFVLNTHGKPDDTQRNLLDRAALKDLSDTLEQQIQVLDPDIPAPQIFGRRFDLFAPVAATPDGDCDAPGLRDGASALLVFQLKEPLYAGLSVATADGPRLMESFARKDLRDAAIVTPSFLRRVLRVAPDAPTPAGFCFNQFPRSYVAIAGVVETLPGSEDLHFEIAMTNDAYLRIMNRNPPASWEGRFPPFQSAALYFDASYAEPLFCRFAQCDGAKALFDPVLGAQYKLNQDALDQVRGLIRIAVASQTLLVSVLTAMLTAVTIAVALSVQSFIHSNERFLCIMRAVGYRLSHLSALFLLEFAIITLAAALPFAMLLGAFHAVAAPALTTAFALPNGALAWTLQTSLMSFAAAYALVTLVGLTILVLWWWWNRHVGHKLQGL